MDGVGVGTLTYQHDLPGVALYGGGGGFAAFFEALGFGGEVVPVEAFELAGHEPSEEAGVGEGEGDAAAVIGAFDEVAGGDLDAGAAGDPGEEALEGIELGDFPDRRNEPGLEEAGAAAYGEWALIEALGAGYGACPLRPVFHIEKGFPDGEGGAFTSTTNRNSDICMARKHVLGYLCAVLVGAAPLVSAMA